MALPTNFVSRSQWGSTFNYGSNTLMPSTCRGVALHWEGSPMGTFTHDQCDNKVRSIEAYHVGTKGWAGIAYNALVCPHGYIFEGRGTKYRSAANGDPTKNNAYFAVCYLGGKGDPFTEEAKPGYIRAVQWLRTAGAASSVIGHRDITSTECPGATIEAWLKATNFSAGTTTPTAEPPSSTTAAWGEPATWKIGSTGPDVTRLGQRLEVHLAALGLPKPYAEGPGPEFTETDRRAVEAFQTAQGWTGSDADGYPGAETFTRLAAEPSAPTPEVPVTKVSMLHWNIAGSDDTNGYGAANDYRGDDLGRYAASIGFDVFLACEAGQDDLRAGVSAGLGLTSWMQRAKAIWFYPTKVRNFSSRKAYSDDTYEYDNTLKWGAAFFGEKDGKKFSVLIIHTDYRAPALQAKQVQSIFKKWRADTDALGIKHVNTFVCGDFNWDGTSGDNPFHALDAWNFEEKGSRTAYTFMERKHLDGVLAHKDADVDVSVKSRSDGNMRLSDHNPVKFTATLQ